MCCEELKVVCNIPNHILCEECGWCPCVEDLHNCDMFFEEFYRNGFGA